MRTLFAWRNGGLTAALLLGFCLAAIAQKIEEPKKESVPVESDTAPAPSGHADRTEQLASLLKLTPAQKAKVKPFVDAETQKMTELRGQKMTRQERSRKFTALRDETHEKIKPLLTPEQVAHWNRLRTFKPTLTKSGTTNAPVSVPVPPPAAK